MVFFGIGKRKKVPDELPDLISDELEKESMEEVNSYLKEEVKKNSEPEKKEEKIESVKEPAQKFFEVNKNVLNRLIKNVEQTPIRNLNENNFNQKSFFEDFQSALQGEISDLNSLENFYNKKFADRDILDDMKNYWAKQKTENVLELLGKNFQEKISEKVKLLQGIEKEWQELYFELIEKEEEIRNSEKELKDLLKEFMQICKNKKESFDKRNNFKLKSNIKNNEKQKEKNKFQK